MDVSGGLCKIYNWGIRIGIRVVLIYRILGIFVGESRIAGGLP